jgi:superfamily I DNA and/or RNA helicase/exoribonuclease R
MSGVSGRGLRNEANIERTPRPLNRAAYKPNNSTFLERVKEDLCVDDIKPELTTANYREKFHKLLCWEEREHITLLHDRCDGFYRLKVSSPPGPLWSYDKNKKYGYLDVPNGDIIAYATQACEAVYLIVHDHKGTHEIRAEVLRDNYSHTGNELYISMDKNSEIPDFCKEIEAQFEVKHFFFDSLHNILNNLPDHMVRRLLPCNEDFDEAVRSKQTVAISSVPKEYEDILHVRLHEMQQDQLLPYQVALSCQSGAPPVLISGAFGTGKTCFLSTVAYCFISHAQIQGIPARILICAHHQATADTILQTYFGPMLEHQSLPLQVKVIRIASKNYRFSLNEKYLKFCHPIHEFRQESREYFNTQRLVIITTFLTSLHLNRLYPPGFFTHILIDEGAQAREPEAIAPLCLASMETKIVIAGDPRQVGPALLVLGEEARENGLKVSLLERLKTLYQSIGENTKSHQAYLVHNFRSHKLILEFASQMFYKSTVKPSHVTPHIQSHHDFSFPIVFVCTSIKKIGNYEQPVNVEEAKNLMNMLSQHLRVNEGRQICVMSSSRAQVTVLRNMKSHHHLPQSVRIIPTFDIQGQEYDSLYISTSEPTQDSGETLNPTKSIADPLVFNTALTRARSLIISFGNPYLLLSIEKHMNLKYNGRGHCWSQLIKLCLQRGTLIIPKSVIGDTNEQTRFKEKLMFHVESVLPGRPLHAGSSAAMPSTQLQQISSKSSSHDRVLPSHSVCSAHPAGESLTSHMLHSSPRIKKVPSIASSENIISQQQVPTSREKRSLESSPSVKKNQSQSISSLPLAANCGSTVPVSSSVNPAISTKQSTNKGAKHSKPLLKHQDFHDKSSASPLNLSEFPTLAVAKNIPKRKKKVFQPPHQEVMSNATQHTEFFQKYREKLDIQVFEEPLTVANYQERFHHLLCWEEKEHMSILAKRCNGRYRVTVYKRSEQSECYGSKYSHYGTISSANGNDDAISYAKQAAEAAHIVLDGRTINVDIVAYGMYYAGDNSVTIGITEHPLKLRPSILNHAIVCDVVFELKHSYFHRQHEALDRLPLHVVNKLFPREKKKENHKYMKVRSSSLYLDDLGQMQALTAILNQDTRPIVIAGPFGTGKTRVLARATYELLGQNQSNMILICTHHQASADTFIEYFGPMKHEHFFRRIRIVRVAVFTYKSSTKDKFPEYFVGVNSPLLQNSKVIVCTLGLSHHLKIKGLTHIFIDEAAQTRETEAIIPLQLAETQTKIVLAGDHCQVGPDVLVLGDMARKHGLATSLLERIHKYYNEIGEISCSFSLLSNYRSHSGIMMLPSSLFYGSTLQCNVNTGTHPDAPFPLVFVCSSIENISSANSNGTDEMEAMTLVNEVEKYIWNSWPEEWGQKSSEVCIMTPSATQKHLIVEKLRRKRGSKVDVLKAYDIQGREFNAVFMGTCETTDESGLPKNTTKTIMNRYVFNTALTRARYLVVAVGNPLQLLEKEEKMHQLNPQNKQFQCWKEFIRRCIECKSFHLPAGVSKDGKKVQDFREVLYRYVFPPIEIHTSDTPFCGKSMPKDSILSAYKRKFENIPECRQSKLRLSRATGTLSWNMKDAPATGQHDSEFDDADKYDEKYTCRLNMISFSSAEAIPLDPHKRVVQIRGMGNIKGAFHGDIVKVAVFSKQCEYKWKGRVISVIEECHKQTLVCKAHMYNPILFCPTDKRYPIITNLPKLSKNLLQRKDKSGIIAELQSQDVVVFEPTSLSEGDIPEIKNVIPHSIAQDMLFVVRILLWNPKFRLPLGVVVHALPRGYTAFHAERLLMIEHNVHYDNENDHFVPEPALCTPTNVEVDTRAFTIDPEDAVNLDDALSLTWKNKFYKLAVHIVDTTKEIAIDDKIDKKAAAQGVSVYGVKRVMNMLPAQTRSKLSLIPHQICDVITVSAHVFINVDVIDIKEIQIEESKIKSFAKLSYRSAQDIMDGTVSTSHYEGTSQYDDDGGQGQPCLKETLGILFRIAMKLRTDRLGDSGALCYEMDDPKEQVCWQTHLMVEELMIWANNTVACKLHCTFPECALLRRQNAPNAEEIATLSSQHTHVLRYSHALSRYIQQSVLPQIPLLVTMHTLHLILEAVKEKNTMFLLNLLTDDSLFPQRFVLSIQFRRIQQRAEYISTAPGTDPSAYHHYALNLSLYTHFTSPLRRYADIIVQRMLKSQMCRERCKYKHDDIASICHRLNGAVHNANSFERKMKTLMLAVEYTHSSKIYEAVIVRNTGSDIEIAFLTKEMKSIPAIDKRIKVRHLRCETKKTECSWRLKLLSCDENSSFPYDYADLFFDSGPSAVTSDFTLTQSVPYISMKLFNTLQSGMLKSVSHKVQVPPKTIAVPPSCWTLFNRFMKCPSEKILTEIDDALSDIDTPNTKSTIGIHDRVIKSPVVMSDVVCRMDVYDVVKVWMTWSTHQAILSPQLQLVEIAPFFRICLQHNTYPAKCFSDTCLKNASKKCYTNLQEYVHLWEKVLLAEAAERSVNDNRTGILYDVKLNWEKVVIPKRIDASHYEPKGCVKLVLPFTISKAAKPFLKVHVGDLMCVRYGTQKNSTVRAVFHLVVTDKEKQTFLLKSVSKDNTQISERMKPLIENEKCEVEVITMSPSYQRVYKVLLSLLPSKYNKKVSELLKVVAIGKEDHQLEKLPPKYAVRLEPLKTDPLTTTLWSSHKTCHKPQLNHSQFAAVKLSLNKRFQLIQGPPGTGKSETGAHIAYALAMSNRIKNNNGCVLYSAPTNKAVDVVLRNLHQISHNVKILRVYGHAIEARDFPGPHCEKEAFQLSESEYRCPQWAQTYALHFRIRSIPIQLSHNLKEMEKMFSDECKQGHIPGAAMCQRWKDLVSEVEQTVLSENFDIVLCTCNESASKRIAQRLRGTGKPRVLQCIVDECGMAYEPETIVPMSLCEHAILLGDHKQLQPIIEYKPAKDNGLTTSLFERYAKSRGKTVCTMLDIQYRMHEEICSFPSRHFYEGKLKTAMSVKRRNDHESNLQFWPQGPKLPILFCDFVGEEETKLGRSKFNPKEAAKVVQIARVIHVVYKVRLNAIALMTPYRAQKDHIKELANDAGLLGTDGLTVTTITESQGDEYGIVILSTVRSQPLSEISNEDHVQPDRSWLLENLGFLTDEHVINVGITRSKYGLIIVGNKTLLNYDDTWKELICHYDKKKCIVDSRHFPKKDDLEKGL